MVLNSTLKLSFSELQPKCLLVKSRGVDVLSLKIHRVAPDTVFEAGYLDIRYLQRPDIWIFEKTDIWFLKELDTWPDNWFLKSLI